MSTQRAITSAILVAIALTASGAVPAGADEARTSMALVPAGTYRPLFPADPKAPEIAVAAFRLDRTPVTNAEFLAFVRRAPEWRRDRIARVFAEPAYLAEWQAADVLGPRVDADAPVVAVSWFAARAYCAERGKRLPREAEWELAAAASRTAADASGDPAWRNELMLLYTRPNPARLPHVGASPANLWGVHDLHGLVWEWVLDYANATSAFAASPDKMRFCGASAAGATSATDFAAFQRVALRTSLKASYTLHNMGFRCAADAVGGNT